MPDPIPVMIIGRLAVDRSYQGRGIAQGLLRDAILRTLQAGQIAGIRAILVHVISEDAKRFYQRHGLAESPITSMTPLRRHGVPRVAHQRESLLHSTGPG